MNLKKQKAVKQRQVLWYTGVFWGGSVKIPPDLSSGNSNEMQNSPVFKWWFESILVVVVEYLHNKKDEDLAVVIQD